VQQLRHCVSGQEHCPTLWVGTNAGTVYIHQLTVPLADKRSTDEVQCVLCMFYSLSYLPAAAAVLLNCRFVREFISCKLALFSFTVFVFSLIVDCFFCSELCEYGNLACNKYHFGRP